MDKCDAIPWSQQVDEDLCEKSSYSTDIILDNKNKLQQSFEKLNLMRCDDPSTTEKSNLNVSCFSKMDKFSNSLKIPLEEAHKSHYGDTSLRLGEAHKKGNGYTDKTSYLSNESKQKKITWASIASQPAKPNKRNIVLKKKGPGMPPPPMIPGKQAININPWNIAKKNTSIEPSVSKLNFNAITETKPPIEDNSSVKWELKNKEQYSDNSSYQSNTYLNKSVKNTKPFSSPGETAVDRNMVSQHLQEQKQNMKPSNVSKVRCSKQSIQSDSSTETSVTEYNTAMEPRTSDSYTPEYCEVVLKQLKDRNNYNPTEMDLQNAALTRYFVIKSYSEDDIHRSIKYEIWCSTDHGNKKLDEAFKERMKEGGNIMLFFSVNGSGHFCGMAQMMTAVDYKSTASVWSQDKWKGKFKVKWIYVKDVPNSQLRHIRLENNDNKSVTNSRDTQEIPLNQGLQMLKILHLYKHLTSIFDDFYHYEKKQEESISKKPAYFDNHLHSLPATNVCHSNAKEPYNEWNTGQFKEKSTFHRCEHSNTHRNRRYGKTMEHKRNSSVHDKEDNSNNSFEKHSNPSIENCGKSNFKEIVFHVNSLNFNDNSIVKNNMVNK